MSTVTFDTLKFVETLKNAGVPEVQAKAQAEAIKDVISSDVATKNDLEKMELRIQNRIDKLDERFVKVEWMLGFNLAMLVTVLFKIFS